MDKKRLMLLMGALVIALGTALAARSVFSGAATPKASAAAEAPKGPKVLVAQRALPIGTIITADSVSFQEWPKELVQDAYFVEGTADMAKLMGTVVRNEVTAGQPITQGELVHPGDRGFLAAALGAGMRAVTIPVSARSGVAGFVFPGDHIDLVLTQTVKTAEGENSLKAAETILRNLRVLATDQTPEQVMVDGKTQVRLASTITLEVTPKIAEKIAVAETLGSISLALRSLADNSDDLEQALATGTVRVPKGATKEDEARLLRAAVTKPIERGTTFTTGGDVSRFQRSSIPAPQSAKAAAGAFGQAMAGAMGSLGQMFGAPGQQGGAPGAGMFPGAIGGGKAPAGFAPRRKTSITTSYDSAQVTVTRGKASETVDVGGN